MFIKVITPDGVKNIKDLNVGDMVLCEGEVYNPVKSIVVISGYPIFIRTSNNLSYHLSKRVKLKTDAGFKYPELWDILKTTENVTPMITTVTLIDKMSFIYDILIEGNMISPEGIVFRYSD